MIREACLFVALWLGVCVVSSGQDFTSVFREPQRIPAERTTETDVAQSPQAPDPRDVAIRDLTAALGQKANEAFALETEVGELNAKIAGLEDTVAKLTEKRIAVLDQEAKAAKLAANGEVYYLLVLTQESCVPCRVLESNWADGFLLDGAVIYVDYVDVNKQSGRVPESYRGFSFATPIATYAGKDGPKFIRYENCEKKNVLRLLRKHAAAANQPAATAPATPARPARLEENSPIARSAR